MGLATSTAHQAAQATRDMVKNVEAQIRTGGEAAYVTARSEAERVAAERRDGVAGYAHDIADAFGAASETLRDRGRATAADLARQAAETIDGVGGRVEQQDIGRMVESVETFARARPVVFFGGACVLGFALVSLLGRSGAPSPGAPSSGAAASDTDGMQSRTEDIIR